MSLARVGWLDSFRDVGGLEWTDAVGTVTFCGGGSGEKGMAPEAGRWVTIDHIDCGSCWNVSTNQARVNIPNLARDRVVPSSLDGIVMTKIKCCYCCCFWAEQVRIGCEYQ